MKGDFQFAGLVRRRPVQARVGPTADRCRERGTGRIGSRERHGDSRTINRADARRRIAGTVERKSKIARHRAGLRVTIPRHGNRTTRERRIAGARTIRVTREVAVRDPRAINRSQAGTA